MPNWGEILKELVEVENLMKTGALKTKGSSLDIVRRKYLDLLNKHTKRNTILYATSWTLQGNISPELITINEEDIQGFMTVISGMKGDDLDLILHSPGGSPTATEALVDYLRSKFKHIRIIIPQAAMSAGTMLACSADEIIMGKHSSLGPTDPQMITQIGGVRSSHPAHAILDQFDKGKEECKREPKYIGVWFPIIQSYAPALLIECQNAIDLSKILVEKWLKNYMFKDEDDSDKKAEKISNLLSDHREFKTHGRHINIIKAREYGLKVTSLEDDQIFQDLVLSIFHTTTHTFNKTRAVKIIENHKGNAFIKFKQQAQSIVIPSQIPRQIKPAQKKPAPKNPAT